MKPRRVSPVVAVTFLVGLACAGALFAAPDDAAPAAEGAFERFICHKNHFTASIPSDWVSNEDIIDSDTTREYGVDLRGPKSADGAYVSIEVIYYGPDHGRFKAPEDFIRVNADPDDPLKIEGESVTPVTAVKIAGRDAVQFDRKTFLFLPIYSVDQKKIPMFERLIVMKGERGFYLLKYSAPEDLAGQYLPVFDKVAGSLKPNS